jgi:hypothetical protein
MQQDNENGVSEPSRRRLLKGMGALVGRWRWRVGVRLPTRKNHKARRERCLRMRVVKRSRFMVSIRRGS